MNSELKEQSGMIDNVIEHSDKNASSIKTSNRREKHEMLRECVATN